jgi:hypothetical protein
MLFDLRGRGWRRTVQSDIAMSIVSGVSLKLAAEHPPPVRARIRRILPAGLRIGSSRNTG